MSWQMVCQLEWPSETSFVEIMKNMKRDVEAVKFHKEDIYYDIYRLLHNRETDLVLGFRESGIDGREMIKIKNENPAVYGQPYKSFVRLRVQDGKITMERRTMDE